MLQFGRHKIRNLAQIRSLVNTLARLLGKSITGGVALQSLAYRCGTGDPKPGLKSYGFGTKIFAYLSKIFADVSNYQKTDASYTPLAGATSWKPSFWHRQQGDTFNGVVQALAGGV